MVKTLRTRPVFYSVIATLVLSIIFAVGMATFQFAAGVAIVNIAIAALAIFMLGVINETNGFRHVLRADGFAKGLVVLIPVAAFFIFGAVVNAIGTTYVGFGDMSTLFSDIFVQITSAFMQNVLFRGLLVTAVLVKYSQTEKGRVKGVFIAAAMYLIVYIPMNLMGGSISLMQLINTMVAGVGMCAAYMYSKNLLSLIALQAAWMVADVVIGHIAEGGGAEIPLLALIPLLLILVWIVVFAVRFSKRAEVFEFNRRV